MTHPHHYHPPPPPPPPPPTAAEAHPSSVPFPQLNGGSGGVGSSSSSSVIDRGGAGPGAGSNVNGSINVLAAPDAPSPIPPPIPPRPIINRVFSDPSRLAPEDAFYAQSPPTASSSRRQWEPQPQLQPHSPQAPPNGIIHDTGVGGVLARTDSDRSLASNGRAIGGSGGSSVGGGGGYGSGPVRRRRERDYERRREARRSASRKRAAQQRPWKKILWVKQSYPDNYTDPPTFLSHLQRNPRLLPYDFWPLVADSTVIVQHVCSVVIFISCFVGIYQEQVSPVTVVSAGTTGTVLGWVFWDMWVGQGQIEERRRKMMETAMLDRSLRGSIMVEEGAGTGGGAAIGAGSSSRLGSVSGGGGEDAMSVASGMISSASTTTGQGLGLVLSDPRFLHSQSQSQSQSQSPSPSLSQSQSQPQLLSQSQPQSQSPSPWQSQSQPQVKSLSQSQSQSQSQSHSLSHTRNQSSTSLHSPTSPTTSGANSAMPIPSSTTTSNINHAAPLFTESFGYQHLHPSPYNAPAPLFSPRNQQRLATVKSAMLIYGALLGLSPIMESLTKGTSSDSIWAMSTWLMGINVFFFDYGGTTGAKIPASLSTNAALMASTVLASRLTSTTHVFSLTLFSIEVFGLFPVFRRHLRQRSWNLHILLTVLLIVGAGAGLGLVLFGDYSHSHSQEKWGSAKAAALGIVVWGAATVLAMGGCSWWLIGLQRYKNVVIGPWDAARPVIRAGGWE